jgi:hypothetical protein
MILLANVSLYYFFNKNGSIISSTNLPLAKSLGCQSNTPSGEIGGNPLDK